MERKTATRIVVLAILFILVAGTACFGLVMCSSNTPLQGVRANAINALIDQTGVKQRVENELYSHAGEIAEKAGIPVSFVEAGIETLDITKWKATTLPSSAVEAASFEGEIGGQNIKVTTYDDASLATISAYGQTITFELPESAQVYTELAPLAQGVHDIGLLGDLLGASA